MVDKTFHPLQTMMGNNDGNKKEDNNDDNDIENALWGM
jgi:hypothetical protein